MSCSDTRKKQEGGFGKELAARDLNKEQVEDGMVQKNEQKREGYRKFERGRKTRDRTGRKKQRQELVI